jgi:undecaprenyl diphosphate synthase
MGGRDAPSQKYFASEFNSVVMLLYLYERLLEMRVSRHAVPDCVALVLSGGDIDDLGMKMVMDLIGWSESLGINSLVLHIAEEGPQIRRRITSALKDAPADICIHTGEGTQRLGSGGKVKMAISLGFGGKREVTEAIRELLRGVEQGTVKPDQIDEEMIEANLRFSQRPDLVIRAGGKQLSDFMIWQAAYSELYFTEVNWKSLRKIDILRAVRDYQKRERRFGR